MKSMKLRWNTYFLEVRMMKRMKAMKICSFLNNETGVSAAKKDSVIYCMHSFSI